jgi:hypothetical protein
MFDHNIGEKRQFFRRKLAKIAEKCDHNIDPWRDSNPGLLFLTRMRCRLCQAAMEDIKDYCNLFFSYDLSSM